MFVSISIRLSIYLLLVVFSTSFFIFTTTNRSTTRTSGWRLGQCSCGRGGGGPLCFPGRRQPPPVGGAPRCHPETSGSGGVTVLPTRHPKSPGAPGFPPRFLWNTCHRPGISGGCFGGVCNWSWQDARDRLAIAAARESIFTNAITVVITIGASHSVITRILIAVSHNHTSVRFLFQGLGAFGGRPDHWSQTPQG